MPNNKKSAKKFKPKPTKSKSQTASIHSYCCYHYTHLQALEPDPWNQSHPQTLTPAARAAQKPIQAVAADPPVPGVKPPAVANQATSPPELQLTLDHPQAGARHPQTVVCSISTQPIFKPPHWVQSLTPTAVLRTQTPTKPLTRKKKKVRRSRHLPPTSPTQP